MRATGAPWPHLLTQSLPQPCRLIEPSTSLQEDDGMNNLQFAQQLWLPFGEPR